MQVTTTIRRVLGRRVWGAIAFSGALALTAGCHSKNPANAGPDPADANLAPVSGQAKVLRQNVSYSPQQQGEAYPQDQGQYPQQAPAPVEQGYPQQQGYYSQQPGSDPELAGEEALEESTEPPPPLPDYDQPPAPADGYIWTPGYWAWGPEGYYWVPGAWVEPPYYGALWTPPYWGWYDGRYRFHHGYWGRHVGYYGGIDYGFGYIGLGYFGGYWNGDRFYYNRAVTRVGPGIRTFYDRPVVYNNVRYGYQPSNRVSYNGGRGGINVRPRPAEVAAMREAHTGALPAQRQLHVEASRNRAQFYNQNHGRPAMAYAPHGFAGNRGVAPGARGAEPGRPSPEIRSGQPNGAYRNERGAAGARMQPNAPRNEGRPMQPNAGAPRYENRQPQPNAVNPRFENRGQPQPQPNAGAPRFENRGQPQPNGANPRFEYRAQPQPQPNGGNQRFENRGQPQQRFENRSMPQPQQQPRFENRGPQQRMEAPRMENRPAPQARPQGAPQGQPGPQPRGGGGGHQGGEHGRH